MSPSFVCSGYPDRESDLDDILADLDTDVMSSSSIKVGSQYEELVRKQLSFTDDPSSEAANG